MPIEVQHQPPLNIVGAGAYNAGVMEGVVKRREELRNRQMQMAQMQQQDRAQRLNLLGQQQSQQFAAQQANQRMMYENYFDQQNMAAQNQQRQQAFTMEQQAQTQRDSRLHDFDMQRLNQQQDFQVMETANKSRGELEQMLGQAQSLNLTPAGQELQSRISNDLEELNKNIGTLRPSDYHFAVQEMLGRAKGLQLPRMQQPSIDPAEEIKQNTFDNPDDGYSYTKTDKGWKREGRHTVNGQRVGEVFRTPTGQDVYYDSKGELKAVPAEIPKLKANVMDKVEKAMAEEEKGYAAEAPMPTFGPGGTAIAPAPGAMPMPTRDKPEWMLNPQNRQTEKMRRFWSEWSVISGEPDPNQQQYAPAPTGGQLAEQALDPNSYRSNQPVMVPQQQQAPPQPQVTAANPSGQPAPQEIPEPEAAAQQAMNPQQAPQPQQPQPGQQPQAPAQPASVPDRLHATAQQIRNIAPQIEPKKLQRLQFLAAEIKAGRMTEAQLSQQDRELLVEVQQRMRAATGTAPRGYME